MLLSNERLRNEAQNTLNKNRVKTDSDWKDVDQKAAEMLRLAMNGEKTIQLVADGNGSFKRSLLPGNYYVVVRSKHREGDTSSELLGKISFQKFEVKSGDEVSVAAKFEAF